MTYRPQVRSRIHSSRLRLKSLQLPWRRSFIAVSISELLQGVFYPYRSSGYCSFVSEGYSEWGLPTVLYGCEEGVCFQIYVE
ncbi:hypothetical protein CEXT_280751 [Caerostris extrusa]|uniref:Uncharacterized protein n=1 Tax=Caerostris extrusa TaxID=172846 RepID=A0AAV4V4C9_CAEEX|nr:hypothetical protein CEXT_280751 [Caerostris extrusa]